MKEYYSRQAGKFLAGGFVLLFLAVFGAASFPHPPLYLFGVALFPLLSGAMMKYIPIMRVFDDRIELTGGLFGKGKKVPFGEITRVMAPDPRAIQLETAQGRVLIPTFALHEWERREILLRLGGPG